MTAGLLGWLVIILLGLTWEAVAIRNGDTKKWPTLSRVLREHAPKWVIAAAIGWLAFHLLSR